MVWAVVAVVVVVGREGVRRWRRWWVGVERGLLEVEGGGSGSG